MLLEALQNIPGTVQIVAGQKFHENDAERAEYWLRTGFARNPNGANSRGWVDGLRWDGADVVILASGPSLSVEQCDAVRAWRDAAPNRKVIAINTTFRRAPWADVLYACDAPWWEVYAEEVAESFTGEAWTQDAPTAAKRNIKLIRSEAGKGLSLQPGLVYQGANGGYQAIGLAYQAGARAAYLLGYDMRGGHWHGEHPSPLKRASRFDIFLRNFAGLAEQIAQIDGFEVVNCTPDSSLKAFPAKAWQEVFA